MSWTFVVVSATSLLVPEVLPFEEVWFLAADLPLYAGAGNFSSFISLDLICFIVLIGLAFVVVSFALEVF